MSDEVRYWLAEADWYGMRSAFWSTFGVAWSLVGAAVFMLAGLPVMSCAMLAAAMGASAYALRLDHESRDALTLAGWARRADEEADDAR